jgi:arylformamidase
MTKVYGDFDQAALDRQYSARDTVPDIAPFIADYARLSEEARAALDCRLAVPYGATPAEVVDVFPAGEGAPVMVFIHGGYWRMLSQKESAFMAPCMNGLGIAVVTVNYTLAPLASIDRIVAECRAAVAWTWRNAETFGANPDRIVVCGSSAGGHLTGMMAAGGWHREFGVPADVVKGAVPISGLHDLEPVRLSNVNEWAQLDPESAARNSPVRHLPEMGFPLALTWGETETGEFKRQSRILAEAWASRGWPVEVWETTGRNHFDIVFDLCDPETRLCRAVRRLCGE